MCRFYCTSEGPSTNLKCLHCGIYYCGACLHGEKGKMENLIKCAGCGKKPRTADTSNRGGWKGEGVNSAAGGTAHVSDSDRTLVNGLRPEQNGVSSKKSASSKGKKGPSIFDKLTDASLYTGAHKHRFDADGKGRGMAGRDAASGITYDGTGGGLTLSKLADRSASDARGLPIALSKVTSGGSPPRSKSPAPVRSPSQASSAPRGSGPQYDEEVKPAPKKAASSKGKKGPSIFDKLTDTSLYTGAHKLRFDANGKGRGMSGRDAASGISYDGSGGGLTLSQLANRGAADARGLPVALKH